MHAIYKSITLRRNPGSCRGRNWYTGLRSSRTSRERTYPLRTRRPDIPLEPASRRNYRNPVIYARELQTEMVHDQLTRRQLGKRHGISSDRVTQWLSLLKLPEDKLREIEVLGDHWDRPLVTERKLRQIQWS